MQMTRQESQATPNHIRNSSSDEEETVILCLFLFLDESGSYFLLNKAYVTEI